MFLFVLTAIAIAWLLGAKFWDLFKLFFLYALFIALVWGCWLAFLYFFSIQPMLRWLGL